MENTTALAAPLPQERRRIPATVRQIDPDDNAAASTILLIRALGVRIPDPRIRRLVRRHANPTSMLAILETLTHLGLGAKAVQVDADHLDRIPLPAIAHLQCDEGPTFAVLHEVSADSALLTDPIQGIRRLGRAEYLARASGNYVIASVPEGFRGLAPARYAAEQALGFLQRRWTWFVAAALAVIVGAAAISRPVLALLAAGVAVSGLLAEFTLNGPRGLAGRLCSLSPRFGCADLLSSPYAFLGVGYSLAALILGVSGAWAAVQLIMALSIPVAAAMVWTMARKSWCPWCLIWHGLNVSALLVAWSEPTDLSRAFTIPTATTALFAFAAPVSFYLWRSCRGALRQAADRWKRLTQNPNVLLAVYQGSAPVAASAEVVLFSHPLCPHCPSVHAQVDLLVGRKDGVRVVHRLVIPNPPPECPDFLDARRFLRPLELNTLLYAIGSVRGTSGFGEALKLVFAGQDEFRRLTPADAMARLGVSADEVRQGMKAGYERLRADAEIARRMRVTHTPTLFLHGRPVPDWATPAQRTFLIDLVLKSTA